VRVMCTHASGNATSLSTEFIAACAGWRHRIS
jgi:hypothetical protein